MFLLLLAQTTAAQTRPTFPSYYWPLNLRDRCTFAGSGSTGYSTVAKSAIAPEAFDWVAIDDRRGTLVINTGALGYSTSGDTLFVFGETASNGTTIYYDPPVPILTDDLAIYGGTNSVATTAIYVDTSGNRRQEAVAGVVSVARVGTVTVPAGTFRDCISVTLSGRNSWTLAPRVGPIRFGVYQQGRLLAYADLTGGTVGGVSVARLTDSTAPQVTVQSPAANSTVNQALITASGTSNDRDGVASVWCQLNQREWSKATGTTAWSQALELAPGTNVVRVYAADAVGNLSMPITHVVNYPASAPLALRITGRGTVSPDYNNVSLVIGASYSVTATPAAGFTFIEWVTSTNWIGGAASRDARLNFAMSSNLTVEARFADANKPTVTISNPTFAQTFTNAQTVTVTASAFDNVGVTRVEFYDGDVLMGTSTEAPFVCTWPITAAANGPHVWTARAHDAAGNFANSAPLRLTVGIDSLPPAVAIVTPSSGAILAGSPATVSGTAADAGAYASGLELVEVRVNGGTWSNATGTATWTCGIVLSPGTNTLEARSRDRAGNYSAVASSLVRYVPANTIPLTPNNTFPEDGANEVPVMLTLRASAFDDPDPAQLGDTHVASQWQVLTPAGAVVADSGADTMNTVAWKVPEGQLHYGSNYLWQVRYRDSRDGWSSYSQRTRFTTEAPRLSWAKQGASLVITWPTNTMGFSLQWAPRLGAAPWAVSEPLPTIVSGRYTVTNSAIDLPRFYRLMR